MFSSLNTNAQHSLRLHSNNQPQAAQFASLPPSSTTSHCTEVQQRNQLNENVNQIEPIAADINAISTIATTSSETNTDALACYYKNCSISNSLNYHKSSRKNDVVFQTPQHSRIRNKHHGDGNMALVRNQSSTAILPPPLFDENSAMATATLPLLPTDSRQLKSRRHHRTIPRHFTLVDSTNSANSAATTAAAVVVKSKQQDDATKPAPNCALSMASTPNNKKSVCQCPVQHVPMTYMGSAHLNLSRTQQPNELLLSTLTKKWPHHRSNVAKSASFTSTPTTSTTALGYNRNSASGLLNPATSHPSTTSTATVSVSLQQQAPKTPSKIITISKQIGNDGLDNLVQSPTSQTQHTASVPPTVEQKSMLELGTPTDVQNKTEHSNMSNASSIVDNTDTLKPSYSIAPIEAVGRNNKPKELSVNPALPPKMCKDRSSQR